MKYDFPEIKMNKKEIYSVFNKNNVIHNIIKDYERIGLVLGGRKYTFIIRGGKIVDIKKSVVDVDFTIKTTLSNLKDLIESAKKRNFKKVIADILKLEIPFGVKLRIMRHAL